MRVERRKPLAANIGVMGIGHKPYWGQFDGLLEIMESKILKLEEIVKDQATSLYSYGMVDDSVKAYAALERMRADALDLLFVDMVTYATSETIAPIIQALEIPIVLVCLQQDRVFDYGNGTTFLQLCNDDICAVPEFCNVAVRMNRPTPPIIIGYLEGDEKAQEEIASYCRIAHAIHDLRYARIGTIGRVLETMYDMYVDPALITRSFGCHVIPMESKEIYSQFREVDDDELLTMRERILEFFDTPEPGADAIAEKVSESDLLFSARTAAALERMIDKRELTGLAYYYEGESDSELQRVMANLIVGNSILTSAGFPMCGEYDLKTCIAMLIMDRLEIGGSFAEFHPMDFSRESILVGHDGPHHINIAQNRPVLRYLKKYHGKPGSGAGVEFNIKEGPITMLAITINRDNNLKFIIAEGESMKGPIPATGNTNTHGKFKPDLITFLQRWMAEGPTHHFALGIGHHAREIEIIAHTFGIECVTIPKE